MCTEPWTENLYRVWMVCANTHKHTHKYKRGKELRGRLASCVSYRDTYYAVLVGGMMDGWLTVCICTALFSKVLNAILLLRLSKPAAISPRRAPPDHTTAPHLFLTVRLISERLTDTWKELHQEKKQEEGEKKRGLDVFLFCFLRRCEVWFWRL